MLSRYQFVWAVPESGFAWADGFEVSGPVSSMRFLLRNEDRGPMMAYKPLELHTGLFLTFAALEETEDAVLAFANRFGRLGVPQNFTRNKKGGRLLTGEFFGEWIWQVQQMRAMVELESNIRNRRHSQLKRVIKWLGNDPKKPFVSYSLKFRNGASIDKDIALHSNRERLFNELRRNELVRPAQIALQQFINEKLTEHSAPTILRNQDFEFGLYVQPKNLLGALWLQLAFAFSEKIEFRECRHCGTPFEVRPGIARDDKQYCSKSCRVMASNRRRKGKTHATT